MSEIVKVRCWKVGQTDKAILVSKTPKGRNPRPSDSVWIPRSVIEHTSTNNADGGWPELVLSLPEWIAEEKGLL